MEREARASGEVRRSQEEIDRDASFEELYEKHPALRDVRAPSWPPPERLDRVFLALVPLLTVLFLAVFFLHLSAGNHDLGQVGWDMEWLFAFPVPAQGLFLARVGEYVLTDVWTWFVFFPFFTLLFVKTGYGGWGVLLAVVMTLAIAALQSALRVTAETWLRRHLARSRLKNVQALATVLSMAGLFGVFALTMDPPEVVFRVARHLPHGLLYLPWTSPLLAAAALPALVVPLLWALGGVALALAVAASSVKGGLLASTGAAFEGVRGPAARPVHGSAAGRRRSLGGIAGKDLKLLFRDRNLMVQMLVIPLFIIGLQFVTNPSLKRGSWSGDTALVVAFGVGAYTLMFGAFSVLAVERRCLWMLYTFPQRLSALLRQKVVLWAALAGLYAVVAMALVWRPHALTISTLVRPLLALGGVWALTYVASGLAVLGTDPFEQDDRKRVSPQWAYLYFLVAGSYGFTLAGASLYQAFVFLVLLTALAWALWQKADDRLPVLLDPVMHPVRRLALPDGLIGVLAFFALQAVLAALFALFLPLAVAAAGAYTLAGLLVVFVMHQSLRPVKDLRAKLGLTLGAPAKALGLGLLAGLAAGGVAFLWLLLVQSIAPLREMRDATPQLLQPTSAEAWVVLGLLMVVAAPLFEEWLFRGILYGGMRRDVSVSRSVFFSAILFAIVHPPLAFPAVLGLGVVTALVRERTQVLWASVLAHAVYNGLVLTASAL